MASEAEGGMSYVMVPCCLGFGLLFLQTVMRAFVLEVMKDDRYYCCWCT